LTLCYLISCCTNDDYHHDGVPADVGMDERAAGCELSCPYNSFGRENGEMLPGDDGGLLTMCLMRGADDHAFTCVFSESEEERERPAEGPRIRKWHHCIGDCNAVRPWESSCTTTSVRPRYESRSSLRQRTQNQCCCGPF
jgi:hypothetical protein